MTTTSIFLRSVSAKPLGAWQEGFPFSVPVIRGLVEHALEFEAPVTILAGENGCGKSTLLEAVACAAGSITVGSQGVRTDPSLEAVRAAAKDLRLVWSRRTKRGFFMRSEDFFGYARNLARMRAELQQDLADVDREYVDRSETARVYARSAYAGQLGALRRSYGEDLDAHSHGESYLTLFGSRFVPGGLYLLDEPEAPLSPLRQLSFLVMLKAMVEQNSQFIIATHSPILMAFPGAAILSLDGGKVTPTRYADLEHVQITRAFLENPERYLDHLFSQE